MLTYWFSAAAAVLWGLIAIVQLTRDEPSFALLAGLASLSFGIAFALRVVERRRA